jgi:hypothetical protein
MFKNIILKNSPEYYLVFFLVFSLSSCEEVVNLDLDTAESKIVIGYKPLEQRETTK